MCRRCSWLFVGLLGLSLSPLAAVSGLLVIASCTEFSVLIRGRYLEERQRGLSPREAIDTAASRAGRAFFTSAMMTIGGFAVLIGSALPLIRDFGILVTLNVAIALLAALVALPLLAVWVDERGWRETQARGSDRPQVGVAPNVANCAIETLASRVSDEDLLALGAATAEPAAAVPITKVVEFGFAELATKLPPATASLQPFSLGVARTRSRSAQHLLAWLVDRIRLGAGFLARAQVSLVDCSR